MTEPDRDAALRARYGRWALIAGASEGIGVGLLIYNAGASDRTAPFLDNALEYSLRQVSLDCVDPMALVRHFGPAMCERGRGGIVIVASLACLAGSATLAVYSAVKAFQHTFAEGLWAELRPYGVDVCCTPLAMTYTPALARMGVEYDPQTHVLPGRRPRDHRQHRQRPDFRRRGEQPGDGSAGVDGRSTHARRDDQRGVHRLCYQERKLICTRW